MNSATDDSQVFALAFLFACHDKGINAAQQERYLAKARKEKPRFDLIRRELLGEL